MKKVIFAEDFFNKFYHATSRPFEWVLSIQSLYAELEFTKNIQVLISEYHFLTCLNTYKNSEKKIYFATFKLTERSFPP